MGRLIDGKWTVEEVNPKTKDGEYQRQVQKFRNQLAPEEVESGRYHLYVSYACPWAHRAIIMLNLKELNSEIDISVVGPWMLEDGWEFVQNFPEVTGDKLYRLKYLRELYVKADSKFSGRVTVPILWDKKEETIINNESSEIIRIFNSSFNHLTGNKDDYYPNELRSEIDHWNEQTYESINNGVYKTGFARTQEAYEKNYSALFDQLEVIEKHLEDKDYLVGNTLTEADIRLFPTLVRFDCVYHGHFKCNKKRIKDFKNLHRYTLNIYNHPKIKPTLFFDHIKTHYYGSHETLNPSRIVPLGPSPLV